MKIPTLPVISGLDMAREKGNSFRLEIKDGPWPNDASNRGLKEGAASD